MLVIPADGLSRHEASSVVEVGCHLMADGLAGAVGQGVTDDGAIFVEIMHPDNGRPMFCIGKEQGRYIVRGSGGDRLAVGPSLNALFAYSNYSGAPDRPTLRLVDWTH